MSPDASEVIAALHQQLRTVLDEQISSLAHQYERELADARRQAHDEAERIVAERAASIRAEAERIATERIESIRAEAERMAAEQIATIRAEAERTLVADTTRVRIEAEQQAGETTARVREELEHALAAERNRAEQLVSQERQQFESRLDVERKRAEEEIQKARQEVVDAVARADAARAQQSAAQLADDRVSERQSGLAGYERLLDGIRALDRAQSLTDALEALLAHAARATHRAAIFLVNGDRLRSWKTAGFPQLEAQPFDSALGGSGMLAQAVRTMTAVASSAGQPAPTFASVPDDRAALAVPVVVGGRAVAVLYADNVGPEGEVPAAWPEVIETLVSHASAVVSLLTASRTLQAMARGAHPDSAPAADGEEQGARRYARLLVSEIKLYNEGAVRVGRERRDLLARLRGEIERARRMYEERVSPAVAGRGLYFQQELVQTLAGGDPGLLGNP